MGANHFDTLTRVLAMPRTRRGILGTLAVTLGLGALLIDEAAAKKNKQKKLKFNEFGCVNVGGKCRGKDSVCCSGICKGKKPKKGKKDKSRCVGHDESTCLAGQTQVICGGLQDITCLTSVGTEGECFTTTGNAGYCAEDGGCFPCQKDADCIGVCGAGAACVPCAAQCAAQGGTACLGPTPNSCPSLD
jgi:hypothetical protein